MVEGLSSETMTREDYDRFVAKNGRTPTQDPAYNHSVAPPEFRHSVDATKAQSMAQHSLEQASLSEAHEREVSRAQQPWKSEV